jgi:hypothetical protein
MLAINPKIETKITFKRPQDLKYLGVKLTKDVEWPYPGNYKMIF